MCKLNLKLTAGPFGIVIEEQQMSCAKFEPQWAYEWQITDSDWAQKILKLAKDRTVSTNIESMRPDRLHCTSYVVGEREPEYEEEWFNGAENETIRFNKIFWTENVCALSALPVRKKTNSAVFDNRPVCASLISNQGHRAEMGRNRPVCEKMSFCHRLDWKTKRAETQ